MARHRWATSPSHHRIGARPANPLGDGESVHSRTGFADLADPKDEDQSGAGSLDSPTAGSGHRWAVGRGAALLVLGLTLAIACGLMVVRGGPSAEVTSVALEAPAQPQSVQETDPVPGDVPPPGGKTGGGWEAGSSAAAVPGERGVPGEPGVLPASNAPSQRVLIHVAGAVASPGIVELPLGARVFEAVDQAGGALPKADLAAINLAAPVEDGLQVRVPLQGETVAPAPAARAGGGAGGGGTSAPKDGTSASGTVNINTADITELETLPRIGPVLAERIIAWRTEHGGFTRAEDLDAVPGIGEAMLAALVPLVTV